MPPNNPPMQPYNSPQQYQPFQPQQAPPQMPPQPQAPVASRKRVSLNPFSHFVTGVSSLVKYNLGNLLAVSFASVIATILVGVFAVLLFVLLAASSVISSIGTSLVSNIVKLIVLWAVVAIVASAINGFFLLAFSRIMIASVKRKRQTLGEIISFVKRRYLIALKVYLLIFVIYLIAVLTFLAIAVVATLTATNVGFRIFLILFVIGILLAMFIFLLRVAYVQFIVADDEIPPSAKAVIKRSSKLFTKSAGALFIYGIITGILLVVVASLLDSSTASTSNEIALRNDSTPMLGSGLQFGSVIGSVIMSATLSNVIGTLLISGIGSIYLQAREVVGLPSTQAPANHHINPPSSPQQYAQSTYQAPPVSQPTVAQPAPMSYQAFSQSAYQQPQTSYQIESQPAPQPQAQPATYQALQPLPLPPLPTQQPQSYTQNNPHYPAPQPAQTARSMQPQFNQPPQQQQPRPAPAQEGRIMNNDPYPFIPEPPDTPYND